MRPGVVWPWGLWLHAEIGWHYAAETPGADLALHAMPLRVGIGAALPAGPCVVRAALQAAAERWWGEGPTPAGGWRGGGGLLVSGSYPLLPWLSAGVDLGVDLLLPGVELTFRDEDNEVFALGQWRWRAGVWVGAAFGLP
ncbi:MAG: hypothetical protein QME96_18345 [Myxococcota bacterium]|nr:hypothetical protein [Myxococcota bacterium]